MRRIAVKQFMLYVTVIVCMFMITGCTETEISEDIKNEGMVSTETDAGEEFIATGIAYLDKGEYEAAMECFQQITPDSKQYSEAQSLLLQTQNSYRDEILDSVRSHIINKEYDAAFSLLSQSQDVLPDDSELLSAYDDVYSAYRSSVLEKVDSYVSDNQYELALEYLNGVQTKFPNDAVLQDSYSSTLSAYQSIVRTEAIEQADAYVADNDYVNAIITLNVALDIIEEDDELEAKLNVYTNTYSSTIIKTAKDQYVEYNAESIYTAERIIDEALEILPDNSLLLSELSFYKDHEPVKLIDLAYDSSMPYSNFLTSFHEVGTIKDVAGVSHNYTIAPTSWYDSPAHPYGWTSAASYAEDGWLLDFQYSKITGVFFFNIEYSSAPVEENLQVIPSSGNDKTWTITNTSDAQNFEVDLSGSKSVKLYLHQDEIDGTFAYLADVYVWK